MVLPCSTEEGKHYFICEKEMGRKQILSVVFCLWARLKRWKPNTWKMQQSGSCLPFIFSPHLVQMWDKRWVRRKKNACGNRRQLPIVKYAHLLPPEKNSLFNSGKHFWQSGFLNLIMDNLLSPDTQIIKAAELFRISLLAFCISKRKNKKKNPY